MSDTGLPTPPAAAPDDVSSAPDHDVRAVLAITPFRRLFLALATSSLGDWLGLLATTSLAARLAGTPSGSLYAVSGVFIFRLAPAVLLGPLAGIVADRLDRRWTLVVGDLLRFALFVSIPLVGTLWWLFVATVLIECVALFWTPAKEATVPNLVPRRRLEAANQLSLAATYGSAPVAALLFSGLTLLNGVLDGVVPGLGADPTYLALYFNALTFLASAVVIWRLDFPSGRVGGVAGQSLWRTALEGWRFIGGTPLVRGLVLGMLGAFAAGGLVVGLAQRFVSDLGAGAPGYGALFAAVFLGLAAGMWGGPRLLGELSRRRLFGLALTAAGVALVVLALVPNVVISVLVTVALGACGGVAWVTGYTLLGLEVGDEVRGRTFAFVQSMVRVVLISVLAIGPIVAALLGDLLGLPRTLRFSDDVGFTYTGVMVTFLLAGLLAIGIGILSFRQMDDRDVPLRTDLLAALRHRGLSHPPQRQASHAGFFVAVEGGDGSGKSTQVERLASWLREVGHEVVVTREPGATPPGVKMREILLTDRDALSARAEALLFAADRAHHVETVVRPALARGAVVLCDRYIDSSVAYQGAGRDLGAGEVAQLSQWATQGLVPDLTVVLDLDPEVGAQRRSGAADRLESEPTEFHRTVRERFLELARRAPSRYAVVDAASSVEEVAEQIRARVEAVAPESPSQRAARVERERREAEEQAERDRVEREERERREAAARAEQEEREKAERERRAAEEAERQRLRAEQAAERERLKAERLAAKHREAAARREEHERLNRERAERESAAQLERMSRERAEREAKRQARSAPAAADDDVTSTRPMPVVRGTDSPTEQIPVVDDLGEEIFHLGDDDEQRPRR